MKKFVLAALCAVLATAAFTQGNINKGDWMLGGTAGFASSKYEDIDNSKVTSVTISPNAGYFFINNFAGGIRFEFESEKPEDEDATSGLLVAPFLRYYFLPSTQKVNVFLDASYGFGSIKYPNPLGGGSTTDDLNQYAIMGGAAVFLTPSTALEFALNYSSAGGDAIGDNRYNQFGLKIGFQIHLSGGGGGTAK